MKQRFLVIAWEEDHDEDLAEHAEQIQDMLDLAQVGGATVITPLPEDVHKALDEHFKDTR